jgi:hypothetical protein
MMKRLTVLSLAGALALAAAGCNNTPSISVPTPISVSEVFPITDADGNADPIEPGTNAFTWHFNIATSGLITATLTRLDPVQTVGLSLGTWSEVQQICQPVLINDAATLNTAINGQASSLGAFCVRIYDSGHMTDPANYVIRVDHP